MLGRAATRIELKIEDDLQEYEEFRQQMQHQKRKEQLQQQIPAAMYDSA
jgi:hypothetical protein